MNLGYVSDAVAAGLLLLILPWLGRCLAATINRDQAKRCGPVVIGFYILMAIYYVMSLGMTSFGIYCILGDIPIAWLPRAIYGVIVSILGLPGLFHGYSVLHRDPAPVDWKVEFSRLKAGLRYSLGLDQRHQHQPR